MLLEMLMKSVGLAPGDCFAEYMLFDGMSPLGHMQGCHPKKWVRSQPMFSFRSVQIGEVK
jgi:hypothetical protein